MQLTRTILQHLWDDIATAGGIFDPATVCIAPYLSLTDRGGQTTLSDVDFGGFPLGGPYSMLHEFTFPYTMRDGRGVLDGLPQYFGGEDLATPVTTLGMAIVDSDTPTTLFGFIPYANPITVGPGDQWFVYQVRLTTDRMARWDASQVFSSSGPP